MDIARTIAHLSDPLARAAPGGPDALALVQGSIVLPRARVAADTARIAGKLVELGIGPGDIVAVHLGKPVTHWMVTLGLMRIGAVSLSLTANATNELAALPRVSAVICGPGEEAGFPENLWRFAVTPDWLDRPEPAADTLPAPGEADATVGRICFTSGTSGHPKAILLDAPRLGARLSGTARRANIAPGATLWCGLGPDTAFGFTATIATWAAGGVVFLSAGGAGAFARMHAHGVGSMVASPAACEPLLRDAVASGLPPLPGAAVVAGGRLSVALRDRIAATLCPAVHVAYGSSEAGGVTLGDAAGLDLHPGHVGPVFDDVALRVVDAEGAPLPPGTEGHLQVRSDSMAAGYLNDDDASRECFVGGWFQAGDIARLSRDGSLTLLGRTAQVLNLGGVKVPVEELEERLRAVPGVGDACALLLTRDGAEAGLVLVLSGDPEGLATAAARILEGFARLGPFRLFATPHLPRGSMGKLRKQEVADAVRAALDGRAPPEGGLPLVALDTR